MEIIKEELGFRYQNFYWPTVEYTHMTDEQYEFIGGGNHIVTMFKIIGANEDSPDLIGVYVVSHHDMKLVGINIDLVVENYNM